MARRPSTTPPSCSTTTAAATFGSRQRTKSSLAQASSSRPSMTLMTRGAPQLTQKWATSPDSSRFKSRPDLLRRRQASLVPPATLDRFWLWPRHVWFRGGGVHVGDPHLVAASLLGHVERLVGAVDQLREEGGVVGGRDADADRQLQAARKRRGGHPGTDALGQDVGPRLRRLVQDERELLSPVARTHIGFARAAPEDLRELRQHGVTVEVPVGVVDLLEMVEVDHQECDRVLVAARPLHLLQEPLGEGAAVWKLGQLVGERVLLLQLEELRVADGDGRLRGDSVEEAGLVFGVASQAAIAKIGRAHV